MLTDPCRRDFLVHSAALGGGLVIAMCLPPLGRRAGAGPPSSFVPNAFLRIAPDETITVVVGKSEMGQGVYTSLPMLVGEELEADWTRIRYQAAPVDPAYNHAAFGLQMTGGSTSVWSSFDQLRKAGATAKAMLIAAAAQTWSVPPGACRAAAGQVEHSGSGRRLTYGQLCEAAARMSPPAEVQLKDPNKFRLIGKPTRRLDSREKVTGAAGFGLDVKTPGMLTAVVARPPVFGAQLKGFDPEQALAVPGVKTVVATAAGVAVAASSFWAAKRGRDRLTADWDLGPNESLTSAGLKKEFAELAAKPGAVARNDGQPDRALASAAKRIEAAYLVPYLAHAPMEPLNCVVDLRTESCEIWTGTQSQTVDRNAAAGVAGLKPEQVQIHTPFLGGGFGRRATPTSDFVVDAVHVGKAVGAPVKVVWTREDDMRAGYYRPMSYNVLAGGLDAGGKPVAWRHRVVGQSILAGTPFEEDMVKDGIDGTSVEGAANLPYAIPNILVDLHSPKSGIPVLWWRSVGHSIHGFVTESFLDELAHAAGSDPFAYRQDLLTEHPRHRGVLELAADKAGWGTRLPVGVARGIALHESFGSFVAQVAEVSVSASGEVRVHRVVCAVDCGTVVNPLTVEAQMQSGIVYGLSAALYGELTLADGRVVQGNFDDYPVLRLPEMPKVEVHVVRSSEFPGGIGEPGTPPIASAVTNAIFALTGVRVRELPIDREALRNG